MLVAALAVVANDADTALSAQLPVPINDPLNEPVFICAEDDTTPDGNIVGAYDADVANDAVAGVNVMLVAALAVVANDELTALLAQLPVPTNVPIKEPLKLPVLI